MNRSIHLIIEGDPTPLARPRFSIKANHVYDSQSSKKILAGIFMKQQVGNNFKCLEGPLQLTIAFYMPIPKSCPKKKKDVLRGTYHTARPDLSNMVKFYEDVANTLIYHDDSFIASIVADKIYDDIPRTEITLKELK